VPLYDPCLNADLQNFRLSLQNYRKKRCLFSSFGGEWCNGSTTDSDSVCLGSNPGSPASLVDLTDLPNAAGSCRRQERIAIVARGRYDPPPSHGATARYEAVFVDVMDRNDADRGEDMLRWSRWQ
jgi:hypothetical protein